MPSIVHETKQGKVLLGGLDWPLLPPSGALASNIRDAASERGASHVAVVTSGASEEVQVKGKAKKIHRSAAGLFTVVDGSKPPKGAHSLAAAFALWAQAHDSALLCVRTDAGTYAVVVVIKGLPVLDRVEKDSNDAFDKVQPYLKAEPGISVFADDQVRYPSTIVADELLTKIGALAGKATALKSVPVNSVRLAVIALVILGGVAGFWYHSKWKAEKARQEAIARQREADPIPKYLNALAAARESAGLQRAALVASVRAMQALPVAPDGWRVTRLGCKAGEGCAVHFFRSTGTYNALRAALPSLELSPASEINLNEARMTWKQELGFERLDPQSQLPALGAFLQGADASLMQTWLVAGLGIQLAPPQLWPQTQGVQQSFKHPAAVAAGKFEVSAIALPQVVEVIETAPANVKWTAWSVEIGDAKQEPLSRVKARLTGTYYVTNH